MSRVVLSGQEGQLTAHRLLPQRRKMAAVPSATYLPPAGFLVVSSPRPRPAPAPPHWAAHVTAARSRGAGFSGAVL